VAKLFLVGRI